MQWQNSVGVVKRRKGQGRVGYLDISGFLLSLGGFIIRHLLLLLLAGPQPASHPVLTNCCGCLVVRTLPFHGGNMGSIPMMENNNFRGHSSTKPGSVSVVRPLHRRPLPGLQQACRAVVRSLGLVFQGERAMLQATGTPNLFWNTMFSTSNIRIWTSLKAPLLKLAGLQWGCKALSDEPKFVQPWWNQPYCLAKESGFMRR